MKKINIFIFMLLSLLFIFSQADIAAQDIEPGQNEGDGYIYSLGDQMFIIKAGLIHPLFFMSTGFGFSETNLSMGGAGSLEWSTYLNNNLAIGGEFGGMFAFSPNDRILYMMPLTFKVSYFFRKYPFQFPIYCGAGFTFNSIEDAFHLDFILKPGSAVYWTFNSEWDFGFNLTYWWVPQIYSGNKDVPAGHTRFGNFLETTFSAIFHF